MSDQPVAAEEPAPAVEEPAPAVEEPAPAVEEPGTAPAEPAPPAAAPDDSPDRITFQSMADRLTLGLLAAVIGAVLVFISAFLTWSTVNARSQAGGKIAGAISDTLGIAGGRLGTVTLVLSLAVAGDGRPSCCCPRRSHGRGRCSSASACWRCLRAGRSDRDPEDAAAGRLHLPGRCELHISPRVGPGVWFSLITSLLIVAGAYVHHIRPVPFRAPGAPLRPRKVDLRKRSAA